MSIIKWTGIWVCMIHICHAQPVICLTKDIPVYKSENEFSSLIIWNNQIYLPTERGSAIFKMNKDGTKNTWYQKEGNNSQIEAACVYQHYLFLLDEHYTKSKDCRAQPAVHIYNIKDSQYLYTRPLYDICLDNGDTYGVEGIAVNNNICYILRERNENAESVLYQFTIEVNAGQLQFSYLSGKDFIIKHPLYSGYTQRYTDIGVADNRLYLLGSYYMDHNGRNEYNHYFIDTLKLSDPRGLLPERKEIKAEDLAYLDLTRKLRPFWPDAGGPDYSTNLEGMFIDKDNIYLVSDNGWEMSEKRELRKKVTLLIRLKKPG